MTMRHKSSFFTIHILVAATGLSIVGQAAAQSSKPDMPVRRSEASRIADSGPKTTGPGQRTFATAQQAATALLAAAEADDVAALMLLFGADGNEILNSGDPVQDKNNRARFVEQAKRSMKVKADPANRNRASVLIGEDSYPFPVPVARTAGGKWRFDTAHGKNEILARRIGGNELDAIEACKAFVSAQLDYASEDRNKNGVPEYARKLISSPGQRDGLFWPASDAPPTEFAEGVSKAIGEGYGKQGDKPAPYHGYYFRVLTAQGPNVKGGALDYIQRNMMIGGFALLAWPAEYGVSGIKTFMVDKDGVVLEKNLGPSTESVAAAMTAFNPDKTWRAVR
jgi:hypothetical protein